MPDSITNQMVAPPRSPLRSPGTNPWAGIFLELCLYLRSLIASAKKQAVSVIEVIQAVIRDPIKGQACWVHLDLFRLGT
jgi:hypothetical protein